MPDSTLLEDMKNHVLKPNGDAPPQKDPPTDPKPNDPPPKDPPKGDDPPPPAPSPFEPLVGDDAPPPPPDPDPGDEPPDDLEAFKADPETKDIDVDKAPEQIRTNLVNLRKKWKAEEKARLAEAARVQELEAALAERPAKDQYEKTLEELNATKSRLGLFDVEATDDWKTQVAAPLNDTLAVLKQNGAAYGLDEQKIAGLVAMDVKQRTEWLKENAEDFIPVFAPHGAAIDRIKLVAQNLKAKHPEVLAAHQERQKQATEQQKIEFRTEQVKAVDKAIEQAQAMGIAYLKPVEGDEEHNALVEHTVKVAKGIPDMPTDKVLRLAVMGASAPQYHAFAMKMMKENKELNAKLDKISGAYPRQNGAPGTGGKGADTDKPKTPSDFMQAKIDEQMAKRNS